MREARGARIAIALLAACALLLLSGAGSARAGEWAQASCVNPNGSAAPSQGWTGSSVGTGDGAAATTACAPGSPMSADLSDAAPEPVYSHVDLTYAPPAGSTIIGGELSIYAVGTGSGQSATGDAEVYEPAEAYPTDVRYSCAQYFGPCSSSGATFTGTVTLPADLGGDVIVSAQCGGATGGTCDADATDGAWARVDVDSTDFVLQNDAVPTAADIIGTALARRVRGTGHVILQAADSGGPGVYEVTATIDGRVVAQETPSTNGGACVAQGTYPGTSALIFDSQQPCPQNVPAELSIPTAGLSDGSHELEVSVTDAAGNSAPVLDRTITTYNPQPTPAPRSGVKTRFSVSWSWAGTSTRLRSITVAKLSRQARVRVYDTGPHRPRLRDRVESARHIRLLLRHLGGLRFHAGDRLYLIVSQPHRRTERIRLTMRAGRVPAARLLRR